ncbi:putative AP2 protein [Hordeum vulgare]|nr:putative AP2 protein [Hordeum vulgare]
MARSSGGGKTARAGTACALRAKRRQLARHFVAPLPAPRPRRATMLPHCRSESGYRGVRERPNGGFYAEICSSDLRLSLGTYDTAHEAARASTRAAWRLGRPRRQMNLQDVHTLQQALDVAPSPRLNSTQDRAEHTTRQRRLLVPRRTSGVMAEWHRRHLEDVA